MPSIKTSPNAGNSLFSLYLSPVRSDLWKVANFTPRDVHSPRVCFQVACSLLAVYPPYLTHFLHPLYRQFTVRYHFSSRKTGGKLVANLHRLDYGGGLEVLSAFLHRESRFSRGRLVLVTRGFLTRWALLVNRKQLACIVQFDAGKVTPFL